MKVRRCWRSSDHSYNNLKTNSENVKVIRVPSFRIRTKPNHVDTAEEPSKHPPVFRSSFADTELTSEVKIKVDEIVESILSTSKKVQKPIQRPPTPSTSSFRHYLIPKREPRSSDDEPEEEIQPEHQQLQNRGDNGRRKGERCKFCHRAKCIYVHNEYDTKKRRWNKVRDSNFMQFASSSSKVAKKSSMVSTECIYSKPRMYLRRNLTNDTPKVSGVENNSNSSPVNVSSGEKKDLDPNWNEMIKSLKLELDPDFDEFAVQQIVVQEYSDREIPEHQTSSQSEHQNEVEPEHQPEDQEQPAHQDSLVKEGSKKVDSVSVESEDILIPIDVEALIEAMPENVQPKRANGEKVIKGLRGRVKLDENWNKYWSNIGLELSTSSNVEQHGVVSQVGAKKDEEKKMQVVNEEDCLVTLDKTNVNVSLCSLTPSIELPLNSVEIPMKKRGGRPRKVFRGFFKKSSTTNLQITSTPDGQAPVIPDSQVASSPDVQVQSKPSAHFSLADYKALKLRVNVVESDLNHLPPKRGRGRPKNVPISPSMQLVVSDPNASESDSQAVVSESQQAVEADIREEVMRKSKKSMKPILCPNGEIRRKRGRPKKIRLVESESE